MSLWRSIFIITAALALHSAGWAQAPSPGSPPLLPNPLVQRPKLPPLPYDELELVTGDAQQIQDAAQRAAAVSLLANAHSLSNVRAQQYDLKTTFRSFGSLPSDGSWTLEDISPSRTIYRWAAQGPSYSAIYLYVDKLLSSNQPGEGIPLRLTQVRDAIFFIYPFTGSSTSLRRASGSLRGVELRCILVTPAIRGLTMEGARNWRESEYCVDPKTGLLETYSPIPGLYIHYDYSNAFHFHDKIIPGAFTISEAGKIVIQARTESVTDPLGASSGLFNPFGLHELGVGSVMQGPIRVTTGIYPPQRNKNGLPRTIGGFGGQVNPAPQDPNATMQLVVVHGIVSPDGRVGETEILASTNANLNQAALERADGWKSQIVGLERQPGTTPGSREIIFTLEEDDTSPM